MARVRAGRGLRVFFHTQSGYAAHPRLRPILCVDVWEHAYYLKYMNLRADYLDAWWHIVDWQFAEENYIFETGGKKC